MSAYSIKVSGLGKKYAIGASHGRYESLRDSLTQAVQASFRRLGGRAARSESRNIWALRDVSFEITPGDVVGIIGRNGAGKSTLLKLLSRITEPTEGEIRLRGRVGSLLEVGTGFHPELTGRENIFLNGAILGMSRREIARKFDEIVSFAELEEFIDTPAKHLSSGMYMRLAFAVAAHLEPEILLVDEVLAVGDAEFQKKCLGKMGEVAGQGRTVLFVSHNMAAIQHLCSHCVVLKQGQIDFSGDSQAAIDFYLKNLGDKNINSELKSRHDRKGTQKLVFSQVQIADRQGNPLQMILSGQDAIFRFFYKSSYENQTAAIRIAFNVFNQLGTLITNINSKDIGQTQMRVGENGYFECIWPKMNLRSGLYTCNLFCEINGEIVDWLQSAFQFQVEDGDYYQTGSTFDRSAGEIFVEYKWTCNVQ